MRNFTKNIYRGVIASLLLVATILFATSANAQVLNNGKIRIGDGAQASITNTGNLNQPWYWNASISQWRKLTYSNRFLEHAFAVGGDGTNEYNLNGQVSLNPVLSGQSVNTSNFTYTSGSVGYGTLISTGTVSVNGQAMEVVTTYFLPQNSAWIKATVKLKNNSSTTMQNVRMWVGTGDDWVGGTDGPTKKKGNLVGGVFTPITSPATRAAAVQITSGAEGVLFYTNSNRGNTGIHYCCQFQNIINQNPTSSAIQLTNDGSYGFFVRMNDLAVGASDEFTWYYAAGELANLDDIINEVASVSGAMQNITHTTADFNATASVNSTGYWMVVPQNSTSPTAAQIEAGVNYGAVTITSDGSGAMTANVQRTFNITGLSAATNYDLYFVSKNTSNIYSTVLRVPFTTLAYQLPVVTTSAVTAASCTSIQSGGNVTSDGGAAVSARGIVWGTSPSPTIAGNFSSNGSGIGAFTSTATGLTIGQTYYVRAYATNAAGTAYGNQITYVGDNTPPVLTCAAKTLAGCETALPNFASTAAVTDNCTPAGSITVTQSPAAGTAISVGGSVTVTLTATDLSGNQSTCSFVVSRPNETPVAVNDVTTVCQGSTIIIDVLANDSHPQGKTLAINDNAVPSHGTLTKNANNTFTYVAPAGYFGPVTFTYNIKASDATLANSDNGHYYEWVPAPSITWNNARAQAATKTYNGLQGYLVTITSATEMSFVSAKLLGQGWMGASDLANEGTWRWVTGPEGLENGGLGRHFSNQLKVNSGNCTANQSFGVNGNYANWGPGEPNDCGALLNQYSPTDPNRGGEHWAHFFGAGQWNDFPNNAGTNIQGYVVEYGGLEGCIPVLTATASVHIQVLEKPVVTVTPASINICPGTTTTLTASGANTYLWSNGATSPAITVGAGTFTVVGTTSGCASNAAAATVTASDNLPPVPNAATLPVVSGQCSASVTAIPTATDNCAGVINGVTTDPTSFTAQGTYTITWRYNDGNGNIASQTQTVIVDDNTAPVPAVASLPTITAECAASVSAPTATDNCGGLLTGTTTDPVSYNTQGTFTINWRYDDGNGNVTTQLQTVVVDDVTPPVISCPFNITVSATAGQCGAVVTYSQPSATDNCGSGTLPTSLPGHTYMGTFGGHTYFLSNAVADPERAHANAIAAGGHLVTISNAQENAFVSAMSNQFIWIGLTDRTSEGTFGWVTSEPASYSNWNGGEPNNYGGNEDWAVINWGPNGTWNDWFYTATALYVIEFEGGNIPTTQIGGLGSGSMFPVGTTTETWQATDAGGNTVTCTFTITVTDNQAPVPVIAILPVATGECAVTVTPPTATDNCSGTIVGTTSNPTVYNNQGTYNIVWTYNDGRGNVSTQNQTVIVDDVTAPVPNVASLPVVTAECTATVSAPSATDNCKGTIVGTTNSPLSYSNQGTYTITWTYNDGNGNVSSQNQTVIVDDITAPVPNTPALPVVTAECTATVTAPTATDNCRGNVVATTINPTTYNNQGIYTITWTYNDGNGNVSTQLQTVTIRDVTPPVITCPASVTTTNDVNQCGAVVTYSMPTATDNCAGGGGSNKRVLLIWDVMNSHTTSLQNALTAAGNVVTLSATSETGYNGTNPSLAGFDAVIHLNGTTYSTGMPAAGQTALVDFVLNKGKTYITEEWSAYEIDAQNSMAAMSEIVVLQRNSGTTSSLTYTQVPAYSSHPILNGLPASFTLPVAGANMGSARTYASNQPKVLMTSTVGAAVAVREFANGGRAVQFQHAGNYNNSPVLSDPNAQKLYVNAVRYSNSGGVSIVQTSGRPSGSMFPVGTTTNVFEATDGAGNKSTCSFTVTVTDNQAPKLNGVPGNATVNCHQVPPAANVGATDNCSNAGAVEYNEVKTDGNCVGNYTLTRTWSVTDAAGNTTSATQIITVVDQMAPVLTIPGNTIAQCDAIPVVGTATAVDNCGSATVTYLGEIRINGNCESWYQLKRTWRAEDECGNFVIKSQLISVGDNTAPTFTRPADVTLYKDSECMVDASPSGAAGDVVNENDNCSAGLNATYSDVVVNNCEGTYTITRTWSLSDRCGNAAADQVQTIMVRDNTAPTFTRPADVTLYKDASCSVDASPAGAAGDVTNESDNCSAGLNATYSDAVVNNCEGTYTITRTWSLADNCGNAAASQVQIITVRDNSAPTFTRPADITLYKDAECLVDTSPSGSAGDVTNESDNCSTGLNAVFSDVVVNNCEGTYTITRTWSLIDNCGNAAAPQVQTITVSDNTAPLITYNVNTVFHCFDTTANNYSVPALTATDNCSSTLAYSYNVYAQNGDKIRSGSTSNASGAFSVGLNSIRWTVTDACGNTTLATTLVTINAPITGTINSFTVLTQGANPNTLYLGYAPASSATIKITAGGGTAPYTYSWSGSAAGSFTAVAGDPSSINVTALAAGVYTYTATVTDAKGCVAKFVKTITVVDVRCGNKNDKVLVCHKTGSASNPYVQICIAPGAVATHLANGSYLGACTNNAVTRTSRPATAATARVLMAYPNPSQGNFNLQLKGFTAGKVTVQVLNSVGKTVMTKEVNVSYATQDETVNLTGIAAGIYQVRVVGVDGVSTTAVVIVR